MINIGDRADADLNQDNIDKIDGTKWLRFLPMWSSDRELYIIYIYIYIYIYIHTHTHTLR